ncbi:sulfurtransferase [Altererythrobacter sp.]|nr:sulfurtransferase [Altererythrobacter sp.]
MNMLISTDELVCELGSSRLLVLDASLHLPAAGRDPAAEFAQSHIPGAQFLGLSQLHDLASHMPGKIPDAARVENRLGELGFTESHRIVLYDDSDLRSACRAWFLLKLFGLEHVAVLDGGLAKWKSENRLLETDIAPPGFGGGITLVANRSSLRDKQEMLSNVTARTDQLVDARDSARFTGASEDNVHGTEGGHIPGSLNLPFSSLLRPDGTFRSKDDLRRLFEAAGVDLDRPVVTTCGSGVTASVLAFALHLIGIENVALYDGSWAEWGSDPGTPKEAGAAR